MTTKGLRKGKQAEFVRWFGPLLDALRDLGGSASPREAIDRIAEREKVPDELRKVLKSGQERFYNQVHWARQYLVWQGLLESDRRGVWALTPLGRQTQLSPDEARRIFLAQVHGRPDEAEVVKVVDFGIAKIRDCLLYTSPSPRD